MSGTPSEREQRDNKIYLMHLSGSGKTEIARVVGLERRQVTRIIKSKEREHQADEALVNSTEPIPGTLAPRARAVELFTGLRKIASSQERLILQRPGLLPPSAMSGILGKRLIGIYLDDLEAIVLQLLSESERDQ